MPIGGDTRYDEPWSEIDKVKRRLDLRYRLKEEGMRKRYDPFLQMKNEKFTDPAVDRYADLRKRGRQPGTPLAPRVFWSMVAIVFLPPFLLYKAAIWESLPWWQGCVSGDIPYEDREGKSLG